MALGERDRALSDLQDALAKYDNEIATRSESEMQCFTVIIMY